MPRFLGADSMLHLMAWVDTAYVVHDDTRSHTDGAMLFGIGVLMCKSTKQKLNTHFLMESEVVRASNYIPGVI